MKGKLNDIKFDIQRRNKTGIMHFDIRIIVNAKILDMKANWEMRTVTCTKSSKFFIECLKRAVIVNFVIVITVSVKQLGMEVNFKFVKFETRSITCTKVLNESAGAELKTFGRRVSMG